MPAIPPEPYVARYNRDPLPCLPALQSRRQLRVLSESLPHTFRHPTVGRCNSFGQPWTPGGFTSSFTTERARLDRPAKHLHDFRGTFATELCLAGLTDEAVAGILGWSSKGIATIRRLYVDQAATVVAMGERLANRPVKSV